jgi:hypothetical protein
MFSISSASARLSRSQASLDRVVGVAHRPEHAVRRPAEVGAMLIEPPRQDSSSVIGHIPPSARVTQETPESEPV